MNKHHKGHEYDKYIAYWKKRLKQGRDLQSERFKRSQEATKSCARLLTGKYQIQRLYLLGSAAGWSSFHERSDLDLAVEGLPADRYFRALSELDMHLPPGIELDLVPLEDAHPELKARIIEEGILLYERQTVHSPSG